MSAALPIHIPYGDYPLTDGEAERLDACEQVIERGLATFVDVGMALLDVRDSRLYRAAYPTFEAYCTERWSMSRKRAYDLTTAAQVVQSLSPMGDIPMPTNERQARELMGLSPEAQREVWQAAVETAPEGKVTAAHVRETAAALKAQPERPEWVTEDGEIVNAEPAPRSYPLTASNHISASEGYDGDEWYTPTEYVEAARRVMGGIDLDPASTTYANETVQAQVFYTKADDGLQQRWFGRVFCNPPYSYPKVEQFTTRLIAEYEAGNIPEAILLVNNSTDTDWFQALLARFPACFTDGRVRFYRDTGEYFGTRQGQAFFYAGPHRERFMAQFARYGVIVEAAS